MKKTLIIMTFAGVFSLLSCSKLDFETDKPAMPQEGEHAVSHTEGLNSPDIANANVSASFRAVLSGDEEVPPADTKARGQASFQLAKDGLSIQFRLIVANIENVTMAHIHTAPAGVNGPVVVWLYPQSPPPDLLPGRSNGMIAQGVFTKDDLVGPLEDMELSDLIDLLESGEAYVNVHTLQFPGGEVRGQIF